MNLSEMRKIDFGNLFLSILDAVTFRVAQDQDYLNVICRGRVKFLDEKWNYMPFQTMAGEPSLVHFNLDSKPWQKDGIRYGEEFWRCADSTPYGALLRAQKEAYTEADVARAAAQTENLIATAVAESEAYAENEEIAARISVLLPV
jgi:lipopolysaccharide biosynthesis glycosyltransferase